MKLPVIHGSIDRRILVNFTVDPDVAAGVIPAPFSPKIYKNKAIVGVCLIRLKYIRPVGLPAFIGVSSENGAHRIAVEWSEGGEMKQGVYIPRRDTSLRLNTFVGGRIFPGKHHLAHFSVQEGNGRYHVEFTSSDDTHVLIDGSEATLFDAGSIFETMENASAFFKSGDTGYSPNRDSFEGLQLRTHNWQVRPMKIAGVRSSFFENEQVFPKGSVKFDNALLMTNIAHEWRSLAAK